MSRVAQLDSCQWPAVGATTHHLEQAFLAERHASPGQHLYPWGRSPQAAFLALTRQSLSVNPQLSAGRERTCSQVTHLPERQRQACLPPRTPPAPDTALRR